MAIATIDKPHWQEYFDRMSKLLPGKSVELEVDALEIGSHIEAEWVPLLGFVYDPASDILAIMVDGLDHMIRHPQALYVDMLGSELRSMEVIDADQFRHIVKLRAPLLLPAPFS
ncbi:hypothetical protein ACFDR9_001028 [Janthinobacterium sp. CG_23.3]|uniref:DUF5335 domain-containing protein n=1 Tax=Janthinobacterium sp. CG_23.3 TaxID=3349634 RepID=UPI0038D389F6